MNKYLKSEVRKFAWYLMANCKEWNNCEWVKGQYIHHINECEELAEIGDKHLQAELLDKAIISCIGYILEITAEDFSELTENIKEKGIIEFSNIEEMILVRKSKFLSKLDMNGG